MKMRKMTDAVLAAVLAASAPLAGAVSNALSVTAAALTETKTEGDWEYKVNENGKTVRIIKYNGTDTDIEFPATLDGKAVTIIGTTYLAEDGDGHPVVDDTVTSVKIPDGVTTISGRAFENCTSLISVTLPDSVVEISGFSGCTSLTSFRIPPYAIYMDAVTFSGCTSLEAFTVAENCAEYSSVDGVLFEKIESGRQLVAYPPGKKDKSYTVPDDVKYINPRAFSGCNSLTSVTLPDDVTEIGFEAFSGCGSLEMLTGAENNANYSLVNGVLFNRDKSELIMYPAGKKDKSYIIPDSVTMIDEYAFSGCTSLTSVTIPDGVTTIDTGVFENCTLLTSVSMPNSITKLDVSAFYGVAFETLTVYYNGTMAEWRAIQKHETVVDDDSTILSNDWAKVKIVCTDGTFERAPATSKPTTSEPTTGQPTTSEPATSEPTTSNPAESTVTPGGSDKQEILETTLKNVDSENGIEGAALDKLLFGESGRTWEQVEKIEFLSADLFSVQYKNDSGDWVKLGGEEAARADEAGIWNTAWTLNTSEMGKDKYAKVISKDGIISVTAKVYIKSGAEKPDGTDQKPTGIALAIAPAVLAAGAAVVLLKKRK